jgi:hypothetical protein
MTLPNRWRAALASVIAVAGLGVMGLTAAAPALADTPISSSPFTWDSQSWCDTYHGNIGCTGNQSVSSPDFNTTFEPAEDGISANGYFNMHMDNPGGTIISGADNSQTQFTMSYGSSFSEKLNLACNTSGTKIAGWPAFWTDGSASGSNFAPGEIDIAEGLNGSVHYGIHYQNAGGTEGSLGGTYPGNPLCGVHTYGVIWNSNSGGHVAFYLDGTWIASITSAEMGVAMFTDSQQIINDYGSGPEGGPDVFGSIDQVQFFSPTSQG